ncbi:Kiwa anti-phage protein KwaB-like domain-containing protein [Planococcus koreensis]|uniref:Kiwa anti-phage protein KwaB-like domain-containing protein n=1 Tax=Planococcus koreensis TaxID=112331 RepID=UPI001080C0C5|nr:Kiwa anti-phage protein KwaB-like domain-containing protein [Planococcus koreensis]
MTLNDENNFVNKIIKMTDEKIGELDLQVNLVSKAPTTDVLFFSKKELLDEKLRLWLKKNIIASLKKLQVSEGLDKKFYISNYSHELTKPDYIAKLEVESDEDLKDKSNKLLTSLTHNSPDFLDKKASFQVIKLSDDQNSLHIIYYRGVKVSSIQKKHAKKMPAVRDRDQLIIQDSDVIEFGGSIELFLQNSSMYILNPRTLEYTFNYDDHIKNKETKIYSQLLI